MRADALPLGQDTVRLRLLDGEVVQSHAAVHAQLADDPATAAILTEAILACQFDGLCWECAPVSAVTRTAPWECVVIRSDAHARLQPDLRPFSRRLAHGRGRPVVQTFPNLGHDAILVVPTQHVAPSAYPHLAAFLREGSAAQQRALWSATGAACRSWLDDDRGALWLSTAGLGVSWVHVRLDSRPKYIRHRPFLVSPQVG